jgi:hypothetical protein
LRPASFAHPLGVPIVVWEDGKVVEIPPEQIELLDEVNGSEESGR